MKKILLSAAFVVATLTGANAQTDVLYEQAVSGTNGIVSDFQTIEPNAGAWSADDFILAENSLITNITVEGFSNSANFDAIFEGIQIYIFADNNNQPSGTPDLADSWLFGYELSSDASGFTKDGTTFSFDLAVISGTEGFLADAGTKYWLSVAAVVNVSATGTERWNWYQAATQGSDPHLVVTEGLFGLTNNVWQSIPNDLGVAAITGLHMLLEGTTDLSTELLSMNNLQLYPNPAKDVVNISNSADTIENVTITDMNGRVVKNVTLGVNEGQINVSDLSQGVYILNATSNGKSFTQKIVKQ